MGERRMFAKTITESDAFRDMPLSSQALYLHIGMSCDDDGFCNKPKAIARCIGASEDDLKLLIAKKFLIAFEDGVVVVKHWKINNSIRADRYKPTVFQEHMARLETKDNNGYRLVDNWLPGGCEMGYPSQVKLSKDKISKDNIDDYKGQEIEIHNHLYRFNGVNELYDIVKLELGDTDIPDRDIKWTCFKIVKCEVKRISNLKAYILKALED